MKNLIILNFWATWCAPCKKEMPSLDRLQVHEDLNNLMIFPINVGQESLQKSRKFFEGLKINNLNNFYLIKLLSLCSFFFGIIIITIYYPISSKLFGLFL